jgi:probable rRNA maturation factor
VTSADRDVPRRVNMSEHDGPVVIAADERDPDDSPHVEVDVDRWRRLALAVLADRGLVGELTLTFVGIDDIAELNLEHMAKQGPTDVLSFPLDDRPVAGVPTLLGDVVISPAVAFVQFADHAGSIDDELALLVVHGVLHVLGHDHAEPDEATEMRSLELALLRRFHWVGPAPPAFRQTHDAAEQDR